MKDHNEVMGLKPKIVYNAQVQKENVEFKEKPMINEKIEYVEYKFKNVSDAIKGYFMKHKSRA